MKQSTIITCLLVCLASVLHAQTPNRPYRGYRMHVTGLELKKLDAEQLIVEVDLINTGQEEIKLKSADVRELLQFTYDPSLEQNGLLDQRARLEASILAERLTLKPGKRCSDMLLVVRFPEVETAPAFSTVGSGKPAGTTPKTGEPDRVSDPTDPEPTACFDLVIERVRVLKRNKKFIEVEMTVRNQGRGGANLYGTDEAFTDNLAVKAYISGVPQLSRGAILLGGMFFDGELSKTEGKLAAQTTFNARARFDLRAKTRYLNQFILALDAPLMARDCDRTNDTYSILIED